MAHCEAECLREGRTIPLAKDRYGYNHPPRAIRDVREEGIPVRTFRVTGKGRLDLLWSSEEIFEYDLLKKEANKVQEEAPEYVKNVLRNHFQRRGLIL